jgi:hypothetical protein
MALEDLLDLLGERDARGRIIPSLSLPQMQEDIDPETGAYNSPHLDSITGELINPDLLSARVGGPLDALDQQPGPVMPNIGNQDPRRGIQPGTGSNLAAINAAANEELGPGPLGPTAGLGPYLDAGTVGTEVGPGGGQDYEPAEVTVGSIPLSSTTSLDTGGTFSQGAPKPVPPPPEVSDGSELIGDPTDNREFSEVLSTLLRRKLGAPASFGDSRDIDEAGAGGFNETIPQGVIRALAGQMRGAAESGGQSIFGSKGVPDPLGIRETSGVVPQQPVGDPAGIVPQPTPVSGDESKALDVSTGNPDVEGLFPGNEDNPIDNLINEMGLLNLSEANRIGVIQNMPDEIRQLVLARLDEIEQISNPSVGAI